MILLQTHYVKTWLSREDSNAGQGEWKEKGRMSRRKVDGLCYDSNGYPFGKLKDKVVEKNLWDH